MANKPVQFKTMSFQDVTDRIRESNLIAREIHEQERGELFHVADIGQVGTAEIEYILTTCDSTVLAAEAKLRREAADRVRKMLLDDPTLGNSLFGMMVQSAKNSSAQEDENDPNTWK